MPEPAPAPATPHDAATVRRMILFTNGDCRGNPGPGGWAYILRHPATRVEKEDSGGVSQTTNNQMELQAVIPGLSAIKRRSAVEVVTDSVYVAKGAREWLPGWKANGWRRREKSRWVPVKTWNCGKLSTRSCRGTTYVSPRSPGTAATRKTSAATNWPWRPL